MRIVAGKFRGRALAGLGKGDKGAQLRPTTDRVRENLFNMLSGGRFGDPVTGADVLDLFAGTGALGLEALSRGAEHVTFVDDGRTAQGLIRDNVRMLNCAEQACLISQDATRLSSNAGEPCQLIFLDPPYGKDLGALALNAAWSRGWLGSEALIVWEEATPQAAPSGFSVLDQRRYGDTVITLLSAPPR